MKKKEAAEFLGISQRTLLRYASQNKIGVTYPQSRGRVAVAEFNDEDLANLLAELSSDTIKPSVPGTNTSQAMTRRDGELTQGVIQALEAVKSQSETFGRLLEVAGAMRPSLSPAEKLLLTLDDCSLLSSLSRDYLGQALRDGQLKGKKIGRGWKVKKEDLQAFIKKL
jgi:excisionase family DNA binding protein